MANATHTIQGDDTVLAVVDDFPASKAVFEQEFGLNLLLDRFYLVSELEDVVDGLDTSAILARLNADDVLSSREERELPDLDPHMPLGQLIRAYPEAVEVLKKYGLHCVGCFANEFDSIESGAKAHEMSQQQYDALYMELEELVQQTQNGGNEEGFDRDRERSAHEE